MNAPETTEPHFGELEGYIRADEHLAPLMELIDPDWRPRVGFRAAVAALDNDGNFDGTANVDVNYHLVDRVEPEPEPTESKFARNGLLFERMAGYWSKAGYRMVTRRAKRPLWILRVGWPEDGFLVSLRQGQRANLWLTVTSSPVRRTRIAPPPAGFGTRRRRPRFIGH